jgi:hypothetical protein
MEETKIFIKDICSSEWNHTDETIKNTFNELLKNDPIIKNIFCT